MSTMDPMVSDPTMTPAMVSDEMKVCFQASSQTKLKSVDAVLTKVDWS